MAIDAAFLGERVHDLSVFVKARNADPRTHDSKAGELLEQVATWAFFLERFDMVLTTAQRNSVVETVNMLHHRLHREYTTREARDALYQEAMDQINTPDAPGTNTRRGPVPNSEYAKGSSVPMDVRDWVESGLEPMSPRTPTEKFTRINDVAEDASHASCTVEPSCDAPFGAKTTGTDTDYPSVGTVPRTDYQTMDEIWAQPRPGGNATPQQQVLWSEKFQHFKDWVFSARGGGALLFNLAMGSSILLGPLTPMLAMLASGLYTTIAEIVSHHGDGQELSSAQIKEWALWTGVTGFTKTILNAIFHTLNAVQAEGVALTTTRMGWFSNFGASLGFPQNPTALASNMIPKTTAYAESLATQVNGNFAPLDNFVRYLTTLSGGWFLAGLIMCGIILGILYYKFFYSKLQHEPERKKAYLRINSKDNANDWVDELETRIKQLKEARPEYANRDAVWNNIELDMRSARRTRGDGTGTVRIVIRFINAMRALEQRITDLDSRPLTQGDKDSREAYVDANIAPKVRLLKAQSRGYTDAGWPTLRAMNRHQLAQSDRNLHKEITQLAIRLGVCATKEDSDLQDIIRLLDQLIAVRKGSNGQQHLIRGALRERLHALKTEITNVPGPANVARLVHTELAFQVDGRRRAANINAPLAVDCSVVDEVFARIAHLQLK